MAVQTTQPWETGIVRRSGLSLRLKLLRGGRRLFEGYRFSSITRRILFLNFFALVLLVMGLMYLNQSESDLIQARMQTLATQAEIIAGAIGKTSAPSPEETLAEENGQRAVKPRSGRHLFDPELSKLSFRINPEFVAPMLRDLVSPTKTRARIYDSDGVLLIDSLKLYARGQVSRMEIPQIVKPEPGLLPYLWQQIRAQFLSHDLPTYRDVGSDGRAYDEVRIALDGTPSQIIRVTEAGNRVMNVALPIERNKSVLGVLLLTTEGSDIDEAIYKQRWQIVYVALLVTLVTIFLSMLLAGTIAGPMRRLALSAERVRKNIKAREQIPDYTHRRDEIGHLSGALRDMTSALYLKMDAIESFAADVAHELKNPLTSLRSAAGMLGYVKTDEDRKKLVDIIQHDVRRLDRLISDISDASRLDAELSRETSKPVNVAHLLDTLCELTNETRGNGSNGSRAIQLAVEGYMSKAALAQAKEFVIQGHDSRLSQVITNLLDNALSFSPPHGKIHVSARCLKKSGQVEIAIEDQGPGIRPDNLDKIFDRFYTDRPEHEEFGQNSGLGLHISKQIVEAHGGRIWAENRVFMEFGIVRRPKKGRGPLINGHNGHDGSRANLLPPPTNGRALSAPASGPVRYSYGARFVIRLPSMMGRG
jgi:two-component system sensor histidine kinase ChvG